MAGKTVREMKHTFYTGHHVYSCPSLLDECWPLFAAPELVMAYSQGSNRQRTSDMNGRRPA
jgi:hypothetical protein